MKLKRLQVYSTEEEHKRFKVIAAQKGITISDLGKKAIEEYLDREDKKNKKEK